jgi:hypothetical protein
MIDPQHPSYVPACDLVVGERVWFPVPAPDGGPNRYLRGRVYAVLDADFAVARGNVVNVVVVRRGVLHPTHSNLVRKTKEGL